ncbi:MAG TPA: cupin domain-containing protein [Patescibacteria group bacterium]|nr:cupin domain-containing protein [Patescibacteria group bacterium]
MTDGAVPPKGRAAPEPDYVSPDGAEIRLILTPEVEGVVNHSVCEATFAPGQVSRAVRHRHVEESWYVLEGEADVWRSRPGGDSAVTHIGPGDALDIPPGFGFQLKVTSPTRLRMVCSTAPPWPGPQEAVPIAGGLDPPTA